MCGIAGFVQKQRDPEALSRMLAGIAHRGPDGEGRWHHDAEPWHVELGHRRLAIIDIADGVQPMGNENGSVVITYNGEVYNFQKLKPLLEAKGHRFRTRCDTEVIVHHFERHGVEGLRDLDGMFAFAIWDSRSRALTLVRDRFGIKPLYYASLPDGGIVFSSELTSLLAHGGAGSELGIEGLVSYFFSDYVHPPETIVRGVRKLPPGHFVVWKDGRLEEPRAFWHLKTPETSRDRDERALASELWQRLGTAVESQLIADVPVGIFLSGGIDSSCIATLAAAKAGRRMKAFSIGFEDATYDESRYAKLVADRLNVEHVCETLHEGNLLDVVDVVLDKLDEPLADPSLLPTFLLSRLAAQHVKVVVGGDAGDELWGGYPTYKAHQYARLYARVPSQLRSVIPHAVARLPIDERYQSLEWKLRRFTERWDDDLVTRHLRWMSSVDLPSLPLVVPEARGAKPATLGALLPNTTDWLQRILALDFSTYMPGSVLTKVDRASMAHGLEVRPPMLDNELVDWAFSLPSAFKLRGRHTKYLLKLAARGHLPDEVIDRRKKGFGIPLATWLRGPLRDRMESAISSSPAWDLGIRRSTFETWNREHQALKRDHSKPLWAFLVLDHWLRRLPARFHPATQAPAA